MAEVRAFSIQLSLLREAHFVPPKGRADGLPFATNTVREEARGCAQAIVMLALDHSYVPKAPLSFKT